MILPIAVIGIVAAFVVGIYADRANNRQAEATILPSARKVSNQIREMRGYYTANVVAPALAAGLSVTFDHVGDDGAIPLPATFVHDLAKRRGRDNRCVNESGGDLALSE